MPSQFRPLANFSIDKKVKLDFLEIAEKHGFSGSYLVEKFMRFFVEKCKDEPAFVDTLLRTLDAEARMGEIIEFKKKTEKQCKTYSTD